jgi:hypothetical protein
MPVGRVGIIYFPFISDTANLMINITTTKWPNEHRSNQQWKKVRAGQASWI